MKPESNFTGFPPFATAGTKTYPGDTKNAAGFIPSDTFPAEWANYLFYRASKNVTELNAAVSSIWTELTNLLTEWGITPTEASEEQLKAAIAKIMPQVTECTTAAATGGKSITIANDTLKAGKMYEVTFTNANEYGDGSATYPTLSINGGTAYPMYDALGNYLKEGSWSAGATLNLVFTGAKFAALNINAEDSVAEGKFMPVTSNAVAKIINQFDLIYPKSRWLRFVGSNHKALKILKGTSIRVGNHTFTAENDVIYDLTNQELQGGTDYFVYLSWANGDVWSLTVNTNKTADTATSRYIGRFHTLCVAMGTASMIMPAPPNSGLTTSNYMDVKPYDPDTDPDFYDFYHKKITAVESGTTATDASKFKYYDIVTVAHPLSGYAAGDILPESVWCLTWKPSSKYADAMVYDAATDRAIDVYLQLGTGYNTRSRYSATEKPTNNRPHGSHTADMLAVGKELLSDSEFQSAALGSNEGTNIYGNASVNSCGGHKDSTNSRRMVSAIGCEDMCGFLWQWLRDVTALGSGSAYGLSDGTTTPPTYGWINSGSTSTSTGWKQVDEQKRFGQMYFIVTALLAGGAWDDGACCGSRSRCAGLAVSRVDAGRGGRGSSRVIRCA